MNTLRARVLLLVAGSGLATALVLGVLMVGAVRNLYNDLIYRQADAFAERVIQMHPDMIEEYERDRLRIRRAAAELRAVCAAHRPLPGFAARARSSPPPAKAGSSGPATGSTSKAIRAAQAYDATMPIFAEDPDAHRRDADRGAAAAARAATAGAGWLMVVSRSADLLTQTSEVVKSYALRTGAKAALLTLAIAVALTAAMMAVLTRPAEPADAARGAHPALGLLAARSPTRNFRTATATTRSAGSRTRFATLSSGSSRRPTRWRRSTTAAATWWPRCPTTCARRSPR